MSFALKLLAANVTSLAAVTDPTALSPAADAVDEAAHNAWVAADAPRPIAAAVLRTAANFGEYLHDSQDGKTAVVRVADLEAWATELETLNA